MSAQIIIFNAGSSSLKFALFDIAGDDEDALASGVVEAVGDKARFAVKLRGHPSIESKQEDSFSHQAALSQVLAWMSEEGVAADLVGAGHRVVHGGGEYVEPTLLTSEVLERLAAYNSMAPLHQPHCLAAILAIARVRPDLPQVACFDTAFHATQSSLATTFALPRALTETGIRRYGFHGLSYEYIAGILHDHVGNRADGRVIVAHLGHGASMCAMRDRKSVATTMGFSVLDGLMMGTRSGAIDPGVLLYLLQEKRWGVAQVSELLYEKSGLLGVSGESDDVRTLIASSSPAAQEAVELFVSRIVREVGSLAAALEGLDALVFTAGIGENAPEVRGRVCNALRWLGVELDADANRSGGPVISTASSPVAVLALHTNEVAVVARACRALIGAKTS